MSPQDPLHLPPVDHIPPGQSRDPLKSVAGEPDEPTGALPVAPNEGQRVASDVGFSVGQALSAALLGGLSVAAKKDYATPFIENQRRLEAQRADKVKRMQAVRFLAEKPGMRDLFTKFGSGDFDTGIERASILDTDVFAGLLEDHQQTKGFDKYAAAVAQSLDEKDPGLARSIRSMEGQGFTDPAMVDGLVKQRNEDKQLLISEESLEVQKATSMTSAIINAMKEGASFADATKLVFSMFLKDGGALSTVIGQQVLSEGLQRAGQLDLKFLADEGAKHLRESSFVEQEQAVKDNPRLAAYFQEHRNKDVRYQAQSSRLTTLAMAEDQEGPVKDAFFAQFDAEEQAVIEQWRNEGKPINPAAPGLAGFMDSVEQKLTALTPQAIQTAKDTVTKQVEEEQQRTLINTGLEALRAAGGLTKGGVSTILDGVDLSSSTINSDGTISLDPKAQDQLILNLRQEQDYSATELTDIFSAVDNYFGKGVADRFIAGHVAELDFSNTPAINALFETYGKMMTFDATSAAKQVLGDVTTAVGALIQTSREQDQRAGELTHEELQLDADTLRRAVGNQYQAHFLVTRALEGRGISASADISAEVDKYVGPDHAPGTATGFLSHGHLVRRQERAQVSPMVTLRYYAKHWHNNPEAREALETEQLRVINANKESGLFAKKTKDLGGLFSIIRSPFGLALSKMDDPSFATFLAENEDVSGANLFTNDDFIIPASPYSPADAQATVADITDLSNTLYAARESVFGPLLTGSRGTGLINRSLQEIVGQATQDIQRADTFVAALGGKGTVLTSQLAATKARASAASNLLVQTQARTFAALELENLLDATNLSEFIAGPEAIFVPILDSDGNDAIDTAGYKADWDEAEGMDQKMDLLLRYGIAKIAAGGTTNVETSLELRQQILHYLGPLRDTAVELEASLSKLDPVVLQKLVSQEFGLSPEEAVDIGDDRLAEVVTLHYLFQSPHAVRGRK